MTKTFVRIKLNIEQTFVKGGLCMDWLQKYNYIKILCIVTLLIITYIYITDDEMAYEQIIIQQGDTLWTLAERYKGNLTTEQWIHKVKKENDIQGEHIVAGGTLTIPIPQDAIYIAINEENEIQSVKVARQDDYKK